MSTTTPITPPTLSAMNDLLWSNALGLRNQELTPSVANATASQIGTILRGVKLKMEYDRLNNRQPIIPLLESGGVLGSDDNA